MKKFKNQEPKSIEKPYLCCFEKLKKKTEKELKTKYDFLIAKKTRKNLRC